MKLVRFYNDPGPGRVACGLAQPYKEDPRLCLAEIIPRHGPAWHKAQCSMRRKTVDGLCTRHQKLKDAGKRVDIPPLRPIYTEHQKLKAVAEVSQVQGEFVRWMIEEKRVGLVAMDTLDERGGPRLVGGCLEHMLAEYHGVDTKELEREKQHMLEVQRERNQEATA